MKRGNLKKEIIKVTRQTQIKYGKYDAKV